MKRVIGLPGDTVQEDDNGFIWIRGPGAKQFVKLKEPYISAQRRLADTAHFGQTWHVPRRRVLHDGRQPLAVVRLAPVGLRARATS